MPIRFRIRLAACLIAVLITGCGKGNENGTPATDSTNATAPAATAQAPSPTMPPASVAPAAATAPQQHTHEAKVVKALQAFGPNTTYLELEANDRHFWIATAKIDTKVGDTVRYSTENAVKMPNFKSTALNRTFDEILFIPSAQVVQKN